MTSVSGKDLYQEAREFLIEKLKDEKRTKPNFSLLDPEEILDLHLKPGQSVEEIDSLKPVYKRLLESAKNRQGMSYSIGNLQFIKDELFGFDHKRVLEFYRTSCDSNEDLFLTELLKSSNKDVRSTTRSHWPQFSRSVISAAIFLSRFSEVKDFKAWVDKFYVDPDMREALPGKLASEIHGIGYTLACDFLKEIGYTKFAKPDVHLREILINLRVSPPGSNDYAIHTAIVECAKEAGVTPYKFDKAIWLIGSGKFYHIKDENNKVRRIGNNKKKFYAWMRERNWATLQ